MPSCSTTNWNSNPASGLNSLRSKYQRFMSSLLVRAFQTSATGAWKVRSMIRGSGLVLFAFAFILFIGLKFVQIVVQPVKTLFPEAPIVLDPLLRGLHGLGVQLERMDASATVALNQAGEFQYAQVFRNGREGHAVGPRQIGDAAFAMGQMFQDAPAGGISQGGKSAIQQSRRTFNHMVNY